MPQHPVARPHRPESPTGPPPRFPYGHSPAGSGTAAASDVVTVKPPAKDLTINKILAGAGAAATSAVLGSFFGAAGTVAGAALGSVASTVATTIYQRSLDRTRDTLVARIRPVAGRGAATGRPGDDTVQMPRIPSESEMVTLRLEPAVPSAPPRRHWARWAGATVLVFVLGLLAVTGFEWIKGSTLMSGDSGTSVGRVLGSDRGDTTPTPEPSSTSDATDRSTPDPTSSPDSGTAPSSAAVPNVGRSGGVDPSGSTTGTPGLLPGRSGTRG